ncbi:MAG: hypothetical protein MUE53_09390 [Chitinophagales bacterium]|nr:hypothetical protein [Chitinophagales bacterium]
MIHYFKSLFEYHHVYNQKYAALFIAQSEVLSEKAIRLFHHTLNAHQIWNNRILHKTSEYSVWQIHEAKDLQAIDVANYQHTIEILQDIDITLSCTYLTSKGETFTNTISDILTHILTHTSYHRGQIASELKFIGKEPISSDYIFYKRI